VKECPVYVGNRCRYKWDVHIFSTAHVVLQQRRQDSCPGVWILRLVLLLEPDSPPKTWATCLLLMRGC